MFLAAKLSRLFLTAALLAGWQASLEHPLRHVDGQGGLVHVAAGAYGHAHHYGDDDGGIRGEHRDGGAPRLLCDSIAAATAVLSGHDAPAFPASAATGSVPAYRGAAPRGAPRLAYRSHAPPHHS